MPGSRSPARHGLIAIYGALSITTMGVVFQGGYLANQVAQNDRRITALESKADKLNEIAARIDGKLDVILGRAPRP